ncbi:guanine-1-methyltransferase-domain-containing protein [Absidia repens]|uniref:tRNA (guanine(9)-N1)-methyltransferase n=1 Tax=Absidia repens TaxID=90262 RepID=A0A1X2IAB2_9FUNG|nr:guanine-1-methyltransferase-domain-containing protein [Absidia repens]
MATETDLTTPQAADTNASQDPSTQLRNYKGIQYSYDEPRFKGLSKNAIKRLLKDQLWDQTRPQRLQVKREKHKKRISEKRKQYEQGNAPPLPKRVKTADMVFGNRKAIIDCSFSDLMTKKEIDSMQAQLVRCYSANRSAKEAIHLNISGFDDALKTVFDKRTPSYTNWRNVDWDPEPYEKSFDKEKLVYLSADSDVVAKELEEDKVYIIGGIVDKNRYKGLCQDKAVAAGIATAQLPIGEYIKLASRKVLTVNQVYEIMLKWVEHRDWKKAFMEVIPLRKLKDSEIFDGDESQDQAKDGQEDEDDDEALQQEDEAARQEEEIQAAQEQQEESQIAQE